MKKLFFLFCFLSLISFPAKAQIPRFISYEGYLTDVDGNVVDGKVNLTFKLYTSQEEKENPLWSEDFSNVEVENGNFSVVLGKNTSFPEEGLENPLYLGISINGKDELKPRQEILSVPYSFISEWSLDSEKCEVAEDAKKIEGKELKDIQFKVTDIECSGCVDENEVSFKFAGSEEKGGKAKDSELLDNLDSSAFASFSHSHLWTEIQCSGCIKFSNIGANECKEGEVIKRGANNWTCGEDIQGAGIAGKENFIPKFTSATTIGSSVIYEKDGKVGIGTTAPAVKLDVAGTGPLIRVKGSVNSNPEIQVIEDAGGGMGRIGIANLGNIVTNALENALVITNEQGALQLGTAAATPSTARLTIDTSGNVGIAPPFWRKRLCTMYMF